MKKIFILISVLIFSMSLGAQEHKNKVPFSSSPNAASGGSRDNSGGSDGPLGPNEIEKEEARERASSMGGAPNVGAGMGTGTGAGSSVGNKVKGSVTAGANEGASDESP